VKISKNEFVIIIVYAYNINIVRTPNEFTKAINCLKKEFEMKDFGSTKFCLRLQIEYLNTSVFVHQEVYIMKVLKKFYMDKLYIFTLQLWGCSMLINVLLYLTMMKNFLVKKYYIFNVIRALML